MSKKEEKSLQELPEMTSLTLKELEAQIPNYWWDERTKVGMMTDIHIDNALLKLQGLGKTSYKSTEELRTKWIYVLRIEQLRRRDEKRAVLEKK